jgi:L,D-transpeptidase YcbB
MKQARKGVDRRAFLAQCAGAAALSGIASRAFADDPLDALMDDGRAGQFGQDFDQASRTIHMPKPTAPMLSPATEQFTEKAIAAYDEIVARGGWPTVPHVDELRVGNRHPSVVDLRQRLSLSGDLDPNAVGAANDIYDSYVEAATRRFQARHGVTVDGMLRAFTLAGFQVSGLVRVE